MLQQKNSVSDSAPNIEKITFLLEQSIWFHDAPPSSTEQSELAFVIEQLYRLKFTEQDVENYLYENGENWTALFNLQNTFYDLECFLAQQILRITSLGITAKFPERKFKSLLNVKNWYTRQQEIIENGLPIDDDYDAHRDLQSMKMVQRMEQHFDGNNQEY